MQPLSFGQTLRAATRLYVSNFGPLLVAVAVVIVPLQVLLVVIDGITTPAGTVIRNGTMHYPPGTNQSVAPQLLTAVISLIITTVDTAAVYRLLLGRYLDLPVTLGSAFGFALDRAVSLFWLAILTSFTVLIGILFLVIPGLYATIVLSVAVPVLVVEGYTGTAAMSRSSALVRGNFWRVLSRTWGGSLLVAVVAALLAVAVVSSLGGSPSVTDYNIVSQALVAGVTILLTPWVAALTSVVYVDLRARSGDDTAELIAPYW
jgi:hypothetical protein